MSDLPELNRSGGTVEQTARNLIPWLESPHRCKCGALCYAETRYVEQMADYMDVWVCRECESRYHRTRD